MCACLKHVWHLLKWHHKARLASTNYYYHHHHYQYYSVSFIWFYYPEIQWLSLCELSSQIECWKRKRKCFYFINQGSVLQPFKSGLNMLSVIKLMEYFCTHWNKGPNCFILFINFIDQLVFPSLLSLTQPNHTYPLSYLTLTLHQVWTLKCNHFEDFFTFCN